MQSSYSLPLVVLSCIVAVLASHVTLSFAQRLRPPPGDRAEHSWLWIVGGAVSMGTGIWSMHFIGMLALHLPVEVTYDLALTAASYLLAVVVSGFALIIFERGGTTVRGLALPGALMGIGVAVMHYAGMAAMTMAPAIQYRPGLFVASILVAIGAAIAALLIAFSLPQGVRCKSWHKLLAASVIATAVVGMHYTGMAAAQFAPNAISTASGLRIDTMWLAVAVAGSTGLILGSTLLMSVFDRQLQMVARSSARLRTANERLEQRIEDGTLHLSREEDRNAAILADLHAAKDQAEAANRAKSAFLATISHEIRTPMNAVMGLLELLSFSPLDEEQRETVTLLRDSSGSLLQLIDDILDFSKIEAGKFEIHNEPARLRDVVAQVAQVFGGAASAKGLTLRSEVADDVPVHALVDALRLRQVLSNFLSNAIKFTAVGDVTLEVRATPQPGKTDLVRFSVTDGGIGMDAETLGRICEPFVQGDSRTSRRYGGTGLGLAICRRLAELMLGTLHVESTRGQGTTVSLVLPLAAIESDIALRAYNPTDTQLLARIPEAAPPIESAARSGQLILVVDDHPTNRRLLVRQLNWLGYAAEAVANGVLAMASFSARCEAGARYGLVITDCQMPEMDGYELATRIRESEKGGAQRTVILAFTANTLHEASVECIAVGMDDVLTKPIELADLRTMLEHWLPLSASRASKDLLAPEEMMATSMSPRVNASMTDEFCIAHEEDLDVLRQGLRQREHTVVARAGHRIKGAALMFGDRKLADAATHLEQVALTGPWEKVEVAVKRINTETARLFADTGWANRKRSA